MGLIKAAMGAAGGVMADQWKEFFYCDAIPENVLAVKGQKKTSKRSSNTKGDDNVISNGSVIAVADGQCMLIVDQGKIVDMCAVAGEYTYDMSSEPSIFTGDLGEGIKNVFNNMANRFTFGGEAPKDQRIYYFNTKELIGNKYGTPSPVPFRVVDQRAGIDIDVGIRCFGEYSYHISNPMLFYTNVCGNVSEAYTRDRLDSQLKTELLTALQPAFARIGEDGIRYSQLPGHTLELADALNEVLSKKWRDLRGIEIVSFGVSSVTADEDDEKMLKELQRNAAFMDPTRAAAHLVGSQGDAMKMAANNQGGAAMAFMGMNMAGQMGGMNAQNLYQMGAQQQAQPAPAPAAPAAPAATNSGMSAWQQAQQAILAAQNAAAEQLRAAQEAQRRAREEAYQKAAAQQRANYDFSAGQVNDATGKALQEAYINRMLQSKNLQQSLSAQGLNGGASETTTAGMYNNYNNARNDLETERQSQLANLLNTYQNNMAQLEQQRASGAAADLSQYQTALQNLTAGNTANLISLLQGYGDMASSVPATTARYNAQTGQWEYV